MNKSAPELSPYTHSRAFSLMEIVVAMGIVCIGLIPLLGIMSMGISQLSSNYEKSAANKVFENMEARIRSTPSSALQDEGTFFYFDRQGVFIDDSKKALYRASYKVHPLSVPGAAKTLSQGSRLKIEVEYIPSGQPIPSKTTSKFIYVFSRR